VGQGIEDVAIELEGSSFALEHVDLGDRSSGSLPSLRPAIRDRSRSRSHPAAQGCLAEKSRLSILRAGQLDEGLKPGFISWAEAFRSPP